MPWSAPARPLSPLPEGAEPRAPRTVAAELEQLDALLARIRSEDAAVREEARREILEVNPRLCAAIDRRVNAIAEHGNRDAMKQALEAIRKRARDDDARQASRGGRSEQGRDARLSGDGQPRTVRPAAKEWQDLVSLLAMSRMLARIGSVEAARELIDVYVRFGEFVRVDTQLMLEKMGDKAVAALIEARRHRAEKISRWAERQLDTLGKAIPGEAVQTQDSQVLADVLRAYGQSPRSGRGAHRDLVRQQRTRAGARSRAPVGRAVRRNRSLAAARYLRDDRRQEAASRLDLGAHRARAVR